MSDAPAPSSPAPVKISLREMADEAQRELAMRHRVYPGLVKAGKMTAAEQAVAIARMRAIRDTLHLLADHEDAVRATLQREIAAAKLKDHAAVAAVHEAFPEATVAAVRPLYTYTEDQHA